MNTKLFIIILSFFVLEVIELLLGTELNYFIEFGIVLAVFVLFTFKQKTKTNESASE